MLNRNKICIIKLMGFLLNVYTVLIMLLVLIALCVHYWFNYKLIVIECVNILHICVYIINATV